MELFCSLAVVKHRGGFIEFKTGSIVVGNMNEKSTPSEELFILVRASSGTKYDLTGNMEGLFTQFLNQGHITVSLKEPSYDIFITNADPHELTAFIAYFKQLLPKDSPVHISLDALEPPSCPINLLMGCQKKYKSCMENVIGMDINSDHFTHLIISDCILELEGYQLPFADAIRKMKNLTTLQLKRIDLRSSTFLEVESKELKQLHLSYCKTPLPIASLFKNDVCYKDSLVELHLKGNRWTEIPSGIFEFRNLLKLSLSDNFITELPDMFTNLPKLEELSLSNNQLGHVPPSIFALQNLFTLSLRNNNITELPNISTNSSKLQELSLCFNRLTYVPTIIFQMQNLSELKLSNNRITEVPDMFANLPKLQKLSLGYNQLTHVPPSIFLLQNLSELYLNVNFITELPDLNLPKLQELSLSDNEIGHIPPTICSLQNLSDLDLNGNLISDFPNMPVNLSKLHTLWLCNNRLSYVPSIIFQMQNMSHLSLNRNHITELPDKFANLPKLKCLSLARNQLQYLPPSIFTPHLKYLDIDDIAFNFEIPPSVGSELIVHSLKELSYRTILNHKLKVKEGMLPKRFLKELDNYQQCICGCKYVDEGQEVSFTINVNDISNFTCYCRHLRVPIRGKMCNSVKSCFHGRFLSVN